MIFKKKALGFAILTAIASLAQGNESTGSQTPEEMVITGVSMNTPLTLETDPKAPRQPLPAQDGADYLKTLPGFSVIRKGGTSGDPVFRGMAGSRLSLLQDGNLVLGGCGGRMDPPTAYIFPETYDRIRLIKGPQTVLYGPGNSAGVVLFERDHQRLSEPGWTFHGSLLGGSFGRNDEVLDVKGGGSQGYVRALASHSQQDNYHDGDGKDIHSEYDRWNTSLVLGWTPNDKVTLELSGGRSAAEAAYADRGMDGSVFDRDNLTLKATVENLSPRIQKLEAQIYYNYVDHVMDNYTLREPPAMPMASNPDRQTGGARLATTLVPGSSAELVIGLDTQTNEHTNRSTNNQEMMPFQDNPRIADAWFQQVGVFGEWTQHLAEHQRLIAGLRFDDWQAEDKRTTLAMNTPNPNLGIKCKETLSSGFVRYEQDIEAITFYSGLGHNERFPDYWELINKEALDALSPFNVKPEATTQLDIGTIYRKDRLRSSVSIFYNRIDDYLMIQSGVIKPTTTGSRTVTVTRNVDVHTWGMEADVSYFFNENWRGEASLASVRGSNDTDNTHLAQMSPLELRLGLYYNRQDWSAGVFWRAVDDQKRVDIRKGNIAGQDIGPSESFNVLSLNLGWRAHKTLLITSGVDNLLDKTYAEHISKAGAMIAGYDQLTRVNEPGRTWWLKAQLSFQ